MILYLFAANEKSSSTRSKFNLIRVAYASAGQDFT